MNKCFWILIAPFEIVRANEEVYNKLKNFRKYKSTNKFQRRNAIAKNHKIEVKEILDKINLKKCRDRIADSESSNARESKLQIERCRVIAINCWGNSLPLV